MTLTTLRDVPWNAPFYAARGFAEMPEFAWGPQLNDVVARERILGFPMDLRVVMRRGLLLLPSGKGARRADEGVDHQ